MAGPAAEDTLGSNIEGPRQRPVEGQSKLWSIDMINKNIRKFVVKSNLESMDDFEVDRLIRNAIRTPDGHVMESLHVLVVQLEHDGLTVREK